MYYSPAHTDTHIRPINLRKDIAEVTNLIEVCFAEHMDAEGRTYLQNIRRISRENNPYYLDATCPEESPVPFHGFVWEDNHRIIGNITLIYNRKRETEVYFIANVAVDPNHRRQGIGQKLTQRAIQHVREHNGKSIILQVREDNPEAIDLYESLGFREITRRTTWEFDHHSGSPANLTSEPLRVLHRNREHWSQQRKWLQELYPEKVSWFLPFSLVRYEPGIMNSINRWLNSESIRFWEALDGGRLIGLSILEKINPYQDYIWLATSPAFENTAIPVLVQRALQKNLHPGKIQINYPAHRAQEAFIQSGFKELNTLIWMENQLSYLPLEA